MLTTVLAIVSMLAGLLSTHVMVVMFLAGGANAGPAGIRQIQWMIATVVAVQALALGLSIALLIADQGWLACTAGLLPGAFAVVLVTVLVKMEW